MQPERLTEEIAAFVDEVWAAPASRGSSGRAAPAKKQAPKRAPAKRAARGGTTS
jgi:hypothetical protein